MQRPGYPPPSPYVAPRRTPSPTGEKPGSLVMITPKEVIEIAVTYIGVIAVCSLIHYVLVEIHRAILQEFSSDIADLIAGFIQALDYAFIISATIAVLIKLFSDTWGAMNYLQIINSSEANKNK
tara:strand:- start:116 stop:487 length:372 start_codon:yes stop_codon:yes gene_type:complete